MYKMAPITIDQVLMMKSYLDVRRFKPDNGFDMRDLTMLYRVKGRNVASKLPGVGIECKWLDRRTDEDEGPYA